MSASDASTAYEQALRGELAPARALCGRLAGGSPDERAWSTVLMAQVWFADPHAAAPSADEVERAVRHSPDIAWRALVELERATLLGMDPVSLSSWLGLHRLAATADPVAHIWLETYDAWHALLEGRAMDLSRLESLSQHARQLGRPALLVELGALRALAALGTGDLDEGRKAARRTSRMARTEGLPNAELLANIVLGRLRRMSGFPHLSGRILFALSRFAAPRFRPWIAWELVMAGLEPESLQGPAKELAAAESAARRGAREEFEQRSADVMAEVAGFAPLGREAHVLLSGCDPDAEDPPQELLGWARGETDVLPAGVLAAPDESGARAYVLAGSGRAPRRILTPGGGLALASGAAKLPRMKRKQGRAETLTAVLALAGPEGLDASTCFRTVYGFEFVPEIHKGTFNVLLHRARAYVEEFAELSRDGARVALRVHRTMLVPDPRCAEPTEMKLLRALAAAGAAVSARAVAKSAGISLRMAQAALQALVDEGVCLVERDGRSVSYRVEDTTFLEPTAHRSARDIMNNIE